MLTIIEAPESVKHPMTKTPHSAYVLRVKLFGFTIFKRVTF